MARLLHVQHSFLSSAASVACNTTRESSFGSRRLLSSKRELRKLFAKLTALRSGASSGFQLTAGTKNMAVVREKVGPGQESVWDYPRPPRLEPVNERIRIIFNSETIVDTARAYRVLETSHPPVYYIPREDIRKQYITKVSGTSLCEWKGNATWWSVRVGSKTAERVAWSYETPTSSFVPIKGYLAFYASPMDACYVGEEKAQPQPGNFYGGWVTSNIVGPFKGGPGSRGW